MPNGYVVIGDVNARFGESVRDLLLHMGLPNLHDFSYLEINDVNSPNDNAEFVIYMY